MILGFSRIVFAGLMILLAASAYAAELPPPIERAVTFDDDVHPILAEYCFKCHAGEASKGKLSMNSRRLLLQGGGSGPVVIEGKSAESLLIQLVTSADEDLWMPPEGPRLGADQVSVLRAWIDQGVAWSENVEAPDAPTTPVHLLDVVPPGDRSGIRKHPNAIDRFLLPYLAEHDIAVPEPVSDALFARRAWLDITGLLPSPEALAAFEASKEKDKRAVLVDQLLADNTAYAEHMMTFWNDHLRNDFKGTGYIDGGRKAITPWLYTALYTNKPFDQFARELVNPAEGSEGFIKGIVWRGSTAAVQRPPMQAAASVSQVFLGVNLKCASCHDSFVNNWKLKDAYGLANCFSDEPMELIRCDNPTGEMASYTFLWSELGEIDGTQPREARLARVADLVTSKENGFFTRTIANRLWSLLLGRGLVEPLDVIQNPAWQPELLDWLARDFIDHGYDLKHLIRQIMTSKAYQWPVFEPEKDKPFVFRGPVVKKLTAEQFSDAVSLLTGIWQKDPQFKLPFTPEGETDAPRAWRVTADPLMRALGRPNREQVTTRRESIATTLQSLELSNGATLAARLQEGAQRLVDEGQALENLVEVLYLQGIQRAPSEAEKEVALAMLTNESGKEGLEDLLWSLAMLPEFQLIY